MKIIILLLLINPSTVQYKMSYYKVNDDNKEMMQAIDALL